MLRSPVYPQGCWDVNCLRSASLSNNKRGHSDTQWSIFLFPSWGQWGREKRIFERKGGHWEEASKRQDLVCPPLSVRRGAPRKGREKARDSPPGAPSLMRKAPVRRRAFFLELHLSGQVERRPRWVPGTSAEHACMYLLCWHAMNCFGAVLLGD